MQAQLSTPQTIQVKSPLPCIFLPDLEMEAEGDQNMVSNAY